ncbi:CoA-transferase [Chloroflexota bacterium]
MMAKRAAQEIKDGQYVNLGIGIPTHVSNWIADREVILHTEIGMLNMGPLVAGGDNELFTLNSACEPVAILPGAAYVDIVESFSMIRGGHIDITIMGAFQVNYRGDYAGWATRERIQYGIGNIGGSMDLATGANRLIIAMTHTTKEGEPKIVRELSYPVTAKGKVDMIITDIAVLDVISEGLMLREIYPGLTSQDIQSVTEPELIISPELKDIYL